MPGRVLIIDGVATNRILMKARLTAACYDPLPASDGEGALQMTREAPPDAILIDLDLHDPSGEQERPARALRMAGGPVGPALTRAADAPAARDGYGLGVLRRLRADQRLAQVPVVALAAPTDLDARIAALRAGADDVMAKPVDDHALIARLRNLMRRRSALADLGGGEAAVHALGLAEGAAAFRGAEPPHPAGDADPADGRIVIVTARPETGIGLQRALVPLLAADMVTTGRAAALSALPGSAPDVYVLEAGPGGPGGNDIGLDLLSDLRSRADSRHAAYVLLRGARQPAALDAVAFEMGFHDVIDPACDPRELALRLTAVMRRKRDADRLRASVRDGLRLSIRDDLTGLHNRRYALHHLAGMAEAARMEGTGFTVMIVDLDRFKAVNDGWGHAAGDAVLVEVSRRLSQAVRMGDLIARIGGEEFLVALPECGHDVALQVADRLREAVQDGPVVLPGGDRVRVTASIGLMVCDGADLTEPRAVTRAIDDADRALMQAKVGGRNQVAVGTSLPAPLAG